MTKYQDLKTQVIYLDSTVDSRYIYQNKLDKGCIQHDMAYVGFKDLPRRTTSDKILHDKAFNFARNSKNDGYERGPVYVVFKFFDEKSTMLANRYAPSGAIKSEIMSN